MQAWQPAVDDPGTPLGNAAPVPDWLRGLLIRMPLPTLAQTTALPGGQRPLQDASLDDMLGLPGHPQWVFEDGISRGKRKASELENAPAEKARLEARREGKL